MPIQCSHTIPERHSVHPCTSNDRNLTSFSFCYQFTARQCLAYLSFFYVFSSESGMKFGRSIRLRDPLLLFPLHTNVLPAPRQWRLINSEVSVTFLIRYPYLIPTCMYTTQSDLTLGTCEKLAHITHSRTFSKPPLFKSPLASLSCSSNMQSGVILLDPASKQRNYLALVLEGMDCRRGFTDSA